MSITPAIEPFADLGRRLISLGVALSDSESTIEQLVVPLAQACGIRLQFRLIEAPAPRIPLPEGASHG